MGYALAFTGDRNRDGKKDFTGAFLPEALKYLEYKQSPIAHVEVTLSERGREQRETVIEEILAYKPSEVAFFCHGLTTKIELGFGNLTIGSLVDALQSVDCRKVAFHACLTGKHDDGFAAMLALDLRYYFPGVRVLGSTTSGHTSRNPHRRLFTGEEGGNGWIVHPSDPEWREWKRRMRSADDPLRWQLLEKTRPEILKELRGE